MSIVRPLHDLVKKNQKWDWIETREGVWKIEEKVYKRTGVSSTRLR